MGQLYFIRTLCSTTIKQAFAYRFSMLMSVITGPLFTLVGYIVWKSLFAASGGVIGGFTFDEMITYTTISFITGYALWDNVMDDLKEAVTSGSLVTYLLKPVSFVWYNFWKKVGHRLMALFLEFIPVTIIAGFIVGFDKLISPYVGYYFAAVAIGFVMSYLLRLIVGMTSFWLVNASGAMWIYRITVGFLQGVVLPLSFYPTFAQKLLFFLPFQFLSFVPAQVFMGRYELAGFSFPPYVVLLYGVLQLAVWMGITAILWRLSVRRFCGAGT